MTMCRDIIYVSDGHYRSRRQFLLYANCCGVEGCDIGCAESDDLHQNYFYLALLFSQQRQHSLLNLRKVQLLLSNQHLGALRDSVSPFHQFIKLKNCKTVEDLIVEVSKYPIEMSMTIFTVQTNAHIIAGFWSYYYCLYCWKSVGNVKGQSRPCSVFPVVF